MNEGHQRFQDWLTAGAEGDPARDLAVHASVCTACQQSIEALDQLAAINTGLARMPGAPTGRERSRLVVAGRLVGATAVLFSAAVLGVGVSQLIGVARPGGAVAQATASPSPSPNQGVMGQTATPQPSLEPTASPTPHETLSPLGTPVPTHRPVLTTIPIRTPAPTAVPTPPPTVPGPIANLSAVAGPGQVALTWSAPADGGSAITGYEVCQGTSSGAWPTCVAVGLVLQYTASGLTPSVPYWYVVRAINAIGPGPNSNEATAIAGAASTVPGPITNLSAGPGPLSGQIALTWSAPADGGSAITGYEVCQGTSSGAWPTCVAVGLVLQYTASGLTPSVPYWYVVRAINAIGPGPNSNEATAIAGA